MRQGQLLRPPDVRAVKDEIEIDGSRRVAPAAHTTQTLFDIQQRMQQFFGTQPSVAGHHHVQESRRIGRGVNGVGLMHAADGDDAHHVTQLVEGPPQVESAVAKIRSESDHDGYGTGHLRR